jgi:hypothetical protein
VRVPGGIADGIFVFSRDGRNFDRRYGQAFLRPGPDARNWSRHGIIIAWGILPTAKDEISIYYTQNYSLKTAHLRRGVLRTDGFVSLRAPSAGGEIPSPQRMGEFTTKSLVFTGRKLELNVATSAVGSVRVEIQNADGEPIEGYQLEKCCEFYGDTIAHTVTWKRGHNLSKLSGSTVRLRFVMSDADLYSIRFR